MSAEISRLSRPGNLVHVNIMRWLIGAVVIVIFLVAYIGMSYYEAYKRREILRRKQESAAAKVKSNVVNRED